MTEQPRLPQRVQRVVNNVLKGAILCKHLRTKTTGEKETVFYFEPGGVPCPPKSGAAAIRSGLLKPSGDGLFDDQDSQTWVAP